MAHPNASHTSPNSSRSQALSFLTACLLLEGCCAASRARPTNALPGAPVLDTMAQRYAQGRSFEDHGTLSVLARFDNGYSTAQLIAFDTYFDRAAGRFMFYFKDIFDRSGPTLVGAIWRTGPGLSRTWSSLRPGTKDMELAASIDAFSGMSLGTSRVVPGMLLGWGARELWPLRESEFRIEREERIGSAMCKVLSARNDGHVVTIWVGEDDHALWKLFERYHDDGRVEPGEIPADLLPPGLSARQREQLAIDRRQPHPHTVEMTIQFTPIFDQPLDEGRFNFTPPVEQSGNRAPGS
jgi:hypothetical protein